jgi:hypothetical protein
MAVLLVVCEFARQVPAQEVDRRWQKVYNLLRRPALPRAEDPPLAPELTALRPERDEALAGEER